MAKADWEFSLTNAVFEVNEHRSNLLSFKGLD
jgi:hypothetical protein